MGSIDNIFKDAEAQWQIDAPKPSFATVQEQLAKQHTVQKQKIKYTAGIIAFGVLTTCTCLLIMNNKAKNTAKNTETTPTAVVISNDVTNATATNTIENKEIKATIAEKTAEEQTKIETNQTKTNFYIDLSKEPELFELEASKSKTITSKMGATITIPAQIATYKNELVKGKITMTLQEYYEKENNAAMLKYHFYKNDTLLQVVHSNIEVQLPKSSTLSTVKFYNNSDNIPDALFQQMQWGGTEYFSNYTMAKTDYTITLPEGYNAKTFLSYLAFENQKILVAGDIVGNSIVFKNIPKGEAVYFTSLGKAKNKYFICNKRISTTNNALQNLHFFETSEMFYNKRYEELRKLSQPD